MEQDRPRSGNENTTGVIGVNISERISTMKRKRRNPQKGPQFERDFCKRLSLWWSQDESRDDVFWRTASSGGRATIRSRKGKTTQNAYGDIKAEDLSARPFTDLILVELKKGYSKETVANLLDIMIGQPIPVYGQWIRKSITTCQVSGIPHWMIISKRDKRDVMCYFDVMLWDALWDAGASLPIKPYFTMTNSKPYFTLTCLRLERFLELVQPINVRLAWEKHQRKQSDDKMLKLPARILEG